MLRKDNLLNKFGVWPLFIIFHATKLLYAAFIICPDDWNSLVTLFSLGTLQFTLNPEIRMNLLITDMPDLVILNPRVFHLTCSKNEILTVSCNAAFDLSDPISHYCLPYFFASPYRPRWLFLKILVTFLHWGLCTCWSLCLKCFSCMTSSYCLLQVFIQVPPSQAPFLTTLLRMDSSHFLPPFYAYILSVALISI